MKRWRVKVQTKDLIYPINFRGRGWVSINALGVLSLLIWESVKGGGGVKGRREDGGREEGFSMAENGIKLNDQVIPRGVVHITAIPAMTARNLTD